MRGSYNEELVLVEDGREEVVLGGNLASEFLEREDARIDRSPDPKLRLVKGRG
jgi:hypothetical protein